MMRTTIRRMAARLSDEQWKLSFFDRKESVEDFLRDSPLMDLACYDVASPGGIDYLEKMRSQYRDIQLLLIAEPTMSPMEYIRPTILASALILRPLSEAQLYDCLADIWEMCRKNNSSGQEERLVIEAREGKTYVPFSKIYYFEAREKKIYVRLKNQELTFYDTLENLLERLPDTFVRCHRSFIVCKNRIHRVLLSKNSIELEQGMEIPLSRSYKSAFKEIV
ncbi:MAG: LytTR family DNA-binding domain-containing protein [Lachnospiraceae bacterium]|nr:LytTR family DNA-binding domain-containing protein [Lachnospiraceae bacterium]